ncbi:MAG: beta-glycosidase, partial [Bacteroidaceae bacterium]|nr:beta-glycosidase [Bacteroidaceae bacterium]
DGAFRRGRIDITSHLRTGADNELLIHIIPNDHPGAVKTKNRERTDFNGGILGADNPTFHSNVGWDWIPTVRGRNIGIWGDVNLSLESDITLLDPLVTTVLDDSLRASVTPSVRVANNTPKGIIGNLSGSIAGISFSRHISIAGNSTIDVSFSPDDFPQLAHRDLPLWWPNGMGAQHLHDAHFVFTLSDAGPNQTAARTVQSDTLHYKAGLRELSYTETASRLQLFVNRRRVHPMGGNWGFPEQNLRYTSREYDIAVRLHKEMNFNMIRNWVGQTPHRAFYEACDRYGILIWQDFWLANPADGPNPSDNALFMDNADDYVYRIRRHPSIALYCGRNEGYPPAELDSALRLCVSSEHPQLLYISSSADDGVSGHGPYWAVPRAEYFTNPPVKLHTERGMPNVMNIESLRRTLAPEDLWPQGDAWGQHDYCQQGAQRGSTFNRLIENYGHSDSAAAFCRWAQWLNYEGHRAMFEADNVRRQGLLMWMSHPCWPSMTWQTYDYFFDTPAAFYAIRKACEPLHIQFDSHRRQVQAVAQPGALLCPTQSGCTAPTLSNPQSACAAPTLPNPQSGCTALEAPLTARALILSREGRVEAHCAERVTLRPDTTIDILHALTLPTDTATHFLRLQLITPDTRIISDNTYLYNAHSDNYTDLTETLPPTTLKITQSAHTVRIENTGDTPALMIRLKLLTPTGDQILPAHFSDNYFHLFPRETRTITVIWNTREHPTAHVEAEWTNR